MNRTISPVAVRVSPASLGRIEVRLHAKQHWRRRTVGEREDCAVDVVAEVAMISCATFALLAESVFDGAAWVVADLHATTPLLMFGPQLKSFSSWGIFISRWY